MQPVTFEEASKGIMFENSYSRLGAVLDYRKCMVPDVWLKLLGHEWSSCDNIAQYQAKLKRALGVKGPLLPMMTYGEQLAYSALPDVVTVYRGCGSINRNGCAWSLTREIAEKFPGFDRYKASDPMLLVGQVKKEKILALKLDRCEDEVISFGVKVVREESL